MRHGFKAYSERKSAEVRVKLGISPISELDSKDFVEGLGFVVWGPKDIPGLDQHYVSHLLIVDPNSWSGLTVRIGAKAAIVINTSHPLVRQANTIMHEWSHIELNHRPSRVDNFGDGLLLLSDYPTEFEEEADWLAATMLLPRDALLHCKRSELTTEQIALKYGVSKELVNWRVRMTGVARQFSARAS